MSGSVIVRHGHTIVDQAIHYDDCPLSWEDADKRAGVRLDRRRAWGFINGELCTLARWTQPCTGCSCDCGDGYGCSHGAGGCEECGYHGKVRCGSWVPAQVGTHPKGRDAKQAPGESLSDAVAEGHAPSPADPTIPNNPTSSMGERP